MSNSSPIASEASILANAFATALCERLTVDEQNIFGNLFSLIGTSMLSIAAINQAVSSSKSNVADSNK